MFVDVVFTHGEVKYLDLKKFGFIAVIDVLRATTTIVTALENGARGVVPVATPEDARRLAASNDGVLLAGERGARAIAGFDLGNSPLECTREAVGGKLIALTTTNGTQAFRSVQSGLRDGHTDRDDGSARTPGQPVIVAACLRNAAAVAREMATAHGAGCSAGLIVCAGTDGRFSADDAYCAAVIVEELAALLPARRGDGARAAARMFNGPERSGSGSGGVPAGRTIGGRVATPRSRVELSESMHGRRLLDMGLGEDVKFCAETSVSDVVPRLLMGMLVQEGTGTNVVNK